MFTLSVILLQDCKNLFQDFWTLFSIYFVSSSTSGLFKKKSTDLLGRVRPGHLAQPTLISRPAPANPIRRRRCPVSPPPAPPPTMPPPPYGFLGKNQSAFFRNPRSVFFQIWFGFFRFSYLADVHPYKRFSPVSRR